MPQANGNRFNGLTLARTNYIVKANNGWRCFVQIGYDDPAYGL